MDPPGTMKITFNDSPPPNRTTHAIGRILAGEFPAKAQPENKMRTCYGRNDGADGCVCWLCQVRVTLTRTNFVVK